MFEYREQVGAKTPPPRIGGIEMSFLETGGKESLHEIGRDFRWLATAADKPVERLPVLLAQFLQGLLAPWLPFPRRWIKLQRVS